MYGDSVGAAFGLVGERVLVNRLNVDISGSIFGDQYSGGAVGENRGVLKNLEIILDDEISSLTVIVIFAYDER